MDSQRIQDDECECQYYDFSSTSFIIEFRKYVLDTIKVKIDYIESQTFLSLPAELIPIYRKRYATLHDGFKKVACAEIKKVEKDIREFFAIPKHVLLPGENKDASCSSSDINVLEVEVREAESEYKKKRALKYLLEKELELVNDLENLLKQAGNVHSEIKRYQEVNESNANSPLSSLSNDLSRKIALLQSKHKYVTK